MYYECEQGNKVLKMKHHNKMSVEERSCDLKQTKQLNMIQEHVNYTLD